MSVYAERWNAQRKRAGIASGRRELKAVTIRQDAWLEMEIVRRKPNSHSQGKARTGRKAERIGSLREDRYSGQDSVGKSYIGG